MENKFEINASELQDIYWALEEVRQNLIDKNEIERAESLYNLKNKIWNQLTDEIKEMIHPERKANEDWTTEMTINQIRRTYALLRKHKK